MQAKNIVVFGATSAISHAVLKEMANTSSSALLIARDKEKLNITCQDLAARGMTIYPHQCSDFNKAENILASLEKAQNLMGKIDLVIIAHGQLPEQAQLEQSITKLQETINTNYTSCASIATATIQVFIKQSYGTLAVISSVAGERGRKSNYLYGACKSATNTLLQGLQSRFYGSDIHIINIKPGMIDTPMTKNFKKGPLWATPEQIAPTICNAIEKHKTEIYAPGYWKYIMLVIKLLPAILLSRLSI